LLNKDGRYAGTVLTADLHLSPLGAEVNIACLALPNRVCLTPQMTIREALDIFERSESDVLPVLDEPGEGHVLGLLTEAHALRRYGEELERRHQAVIRG
jgi:CIC family chloride channel protein